MKRNMWIKMTNKLNKRYNEMLEIQKDYFLKINFEKWKKESLLDFINFFRYNYPDEFKNVGFSFDEWRRGN